MRKSTQQEKEVFLFLNNLRVSGITNMYGASPYVQEEFNIEAGEAKRLVAIWMRNFDAEGNYDEIAVEDE